jgi:pyruvate dehydrogenase E2 component (dihydrolipoamide acetyltransferase)
VDGPEAEDVPKREAVLVGYGAADGPRALRRRRQWDNAASVTPDLQTPPATPDATRPLAKPPVRKLARDLGVDLATVAGTGSSGVITRHDVLSATPRQDGSARPARSIPPREERDDVRPGSVIPVRGRRAQIAKRMSLSRSTIPEASCGVEVDCTALLRARDVVRDATEDVDLARAVTTFVVVLRYVAVALRANPVINSTFDEAEQVIRIYDRVDLGVATSTDRGLLVPVVKGAHELDTYGIAREVARLASGARAGTLLLTELQGSTFTVTNYGALGLDDGYPVINYPEAAILGVGSVKERPVAIDGQLAVRPTAKLILSFDHRVCDGAEAAAFLKTLRALIEEPVNLLVHV